MRVLQALLISLAVHIFLMIFINLLPVEPPANKEVVEFDIRPTAPVPPQNETTKKMVLAADISDSLKIKESEDKLKFLADKLQRVKEQTQAKVAGLTKNRTLSERSDEARNENHQDSINNKLNNKNTKKMTLDPFATGAKPIGRAGRHSEMNYGISTNSSELDDRLKSGTITALNTDRYLFYSFFSRASELIYFRWDSAVQAALPGVAARMAGRGGADKWTTLIEIWLKPSGEFHSAHLMKESGITEFDRVAADAFRQAGFFPNPPKELVEADGFIRLKWGLTVYFDPKVLAGK